MSNTTKTMTIRQAMLAGLKKRCIEVTDKLREKDTRKEKKSKFSREEVAELELLLKSCGWDANNIQRQMKIYSILHSAPELTKGAMIPLEFMAVVVVEANSGGHGYRVNAPHIVSSKESRSFLHTDGAITNWAIQATDRPRLATDEEIESCIHQLNDAQIKTIQTHNTFKPVMDEIMNTAVQVSEETPDSEDGDGEVELADGRKISVSE